MWGYFGKAPEKGHLEHPRSACCTDDMPEIFVHFGQCLAFRLFLSTGSHHVLIQIHATCCCVPMHHRNHWFGKTHALVVQTVCRLLVRSPLAKQKGLGQPVHSNLHAPQGTPDFDHRRGRFFCKSILGP